MGYSNYDVINDGKSFQGTSSNVSIFQHLRFKFEIIKHKISDQRIGI